MKKEIMRIDADTVSANPLVFREMYLEWTVEGTDYHASSGFTPLS